MFAIVELTSSLINFSQIPITDAVKLNQDFDLLTYLLIGLSLIIVLRKVFEPCLQKWTICYGSYVMDHMLWVMCYEGFV